MESKSTFCFFILMHKKRKKRVIYIKTYKKEKLFFKNPLQFFLGYGIICPYVAQRRNDVKEHQNYEMRYLS